MVFLGIFVDFTDSFVEFTHCFVDYGRVRHLRASSKIFTNLRSFGAFGEVTIFFVEFTHFFVDFWCYKRLRASSKIFKILASRLFSSPCLSQILSSTLEPRLLLIFRFQFFHHIVERKFLTNYLEKVLCFYYKGGCCHMNYNI